MPVPAPPAHGGYPDPAGAPYRLRIDGRRYGNAVVGGILHLASEFPGDRQVLIDIPRPAGTTTISLPVWIDPRDPAWPAALQRVLRHHRRPDARSTR